MRAKKAKVPPNPGVSRTQSAETLKERIVEWFLERCPDDTLALLADEHQHAAFVGIVLTGPNHQPMAVYDLDLLWEAEKALDPQADDDELYDHLSYNVLGSAQPDVGPLFLRRFPPKEDE